MFNQFWEVVSVLVIVVTMATVTVLQQYSPVTEYWDVKAIYLRILQLHITNNINDEHEENGSLTGYKQARNGTNIFLSSYECPYMLIDIYNYQYMIFFIF